MPEMIFHIRWPDGTSEACYSPSLVIKDYFSQGATYSVADFVERSRTALHIASDRVEAKRGWPCARAIAQLSSIESSARRFTEVSDARVTVDAFEE